MVVEEMSGLLLFSPNIIVDTLFTLLRIIPLQLEGLAIMKHYIFTVKNNSIQKKIENPTWCVYPLRH